MRAFIKDSVFYSASRYVLLGFGIIRNLAIAKVLGPQEYGLWVIVSLVLILGDQLHLGLRHAGDREIPLLRGRGDEQGAAAFANAAFGGIIMFSAVGLVFLAGTSLLLENGPTALKIGLLGAGVSLFFDQLNRFFLMVLRARKEFMFSSKMETFMEAFRTVVVTTFAYFFHFSGAIIAMALTAAVNATYFLVRNANAIEPVFHLPEVRRVLKSGFPLFTVGAVYAVILNIDRLAGSFLLTKEELGIYGVAALIAQLPLSFTQSVSSVYYPTLNEILGRWGDVRKAFATFSQVIYGIAFFAPLLVVTVFYGAKAFLLLFFSEYADSSSVLAVLLPSIFFASFLPLLAGVHTASGHERAFLISEMIALVGSVACFSAAFMIFRGLMAVSAGMTVSMMLFAGVMIATTYRIFSLPSLKVLREIFKIYSSSVISILLVFGLLPLLSLGKEGIAGIVLEYVAYLVLYLPVLLIGHRVVGFSLRLKEPGSIRV